MSWFRKSQPADTRLPLQEALVASAWGFTEDGWSRLDNAGRTYCRTNYTKAPRYVK